MKHPRRWLRLSRWTRRLRWVALGAMVLLALALMPSPLYWSDFEVTHEWVIGFLGWDGGMNRLYETGVVPLPKLKPDATAQRGWGILLSMIAAGVLAAVFVKQMGRMRRAGWWVSAGLLAVPLAMLAMAAVALGSEWLGIWRPWFVRETWLLSYGYRLDDGRDGLIYGLLFSLWAAGALLLKPVLGRRGWPIAVVGAAAGGVLVLAALLGFVLTGGHDTSWPSTRRYLFGGIHTAVWLGVLAMVWDVVFLGVLAWSWPHGPRRFEWRRRRWRSVRCGGCGYDLRGSVVAGRRACPECGEAVVPVQAAHVRRVHGVGVEG